jgi:membrane protease YdiL (CAAX protease family)
VENGQIKFDRRKTMREVIIFAVIILVSGWIGAAINVLLKQEQTVQSLGSLIWILTPIIMVIIIRTKNHEWKEAGIKPHFKGNLATYLFSILFYPILTLVLVGIGLLTNQVNLSNFSWTIFLPVMAAAIGANFFKNISEEMAWRGYLTQKLFSLKITDWKAYILTGLIWNLWHGAYYLLFLPDENFKTNSRLYLLLWGCVLLVAWSFLFGEIYHKTKSVWPCVILHAIEDGVPTVLIMTGEYITFSKSSEWILHPITGLISVVVILGTGLFMLVNRRKKVLF